MQIQNQINEEFEANVDDKKRRVAAKGHVGHPKYALLYECSSWLSLSDREFIRRCSLILLINEYIKDRTYKYARIENYHFT